MKVPLYYLFVIKQGTLVDELTFYKRYIQNLDRDLNSIYLFIIHHPSFNYYLHTHRLINVFRSEIQFLNQFRIYTHT